MRTVSPIHAPIRDEHVIEVDPPLRPELPGVWLRRINPFTGRSLSDKALTAEQDARAGVQRLRGQGLTAGAVSGLDLQLEPGAVGAAPADARFQLLPGLGLTQWGEDVVVSSPRRLALGDLPVYARADHLDALAAGDDALPGDPEGAQTPDPDDVSGGILERLRPRLPRRIGPTLTEVLKAKAAGDLPRAAILVAEPTTATILARPDPDPCPRDPRDDPYDDLQLIDGCRLALYVWPGEMTALVGNNDYSLPSLGADFRNKLAYRVFNVERSALPGEWHPWEHVGVPVALVGFKADWTLDFIDRGAVARMGGQPNPRTPLVPQAGTPILWQARLAQFIEQYGELADQSPAGLAAAFRQLPPIGFLPRSVINLDTRRQTFFPPGFSLSAAPIPLEHVDVAVRDSASLIPLSLDTPDQVELLVPVPERVYEPGLLEVATIDPAFDQAIARYVADRTRWLLRREMVRRRRDLLVDSTTGQRPSWPAQDLPLAEALPYPTHRGPVTCTRVRTFTAPANAARAHIFTGAGSSLEVAPGDRIYLWVRVVDPANLTGLLLRLGAGTAVDGSGDFDFNVFWGAGDNLPVGAVASAPANLRQGDLPPTGIWTRLEVPASAVWKSTGGNLVGAKVNAAFFAQRGGSVQWGPLGKISAGGDEVVYVGDDAPPGSTLLAADQTTWPFQPAGAGDAPAEADFGTVSAGGVRTVGAVDDFRARWTQPFLAPHFATLAEVGLDGFIADLDARLKSTNDAVDLGFVRARADIYRVRTYMLGADAASRLVTSPSLADLAVREEGARAKALDISNFLRSAYATDFRRDPDSPLDPPKTPPPSTPPPAQPAPGNPGGVVRGPSNVFATGLRLDMLRSTVAGPTASRASAAVFAPSRAAAAAAIESRATAATVFVRPEAPVATGPRIGVVTAFQAPAQNLSIAALRASGVFTQVISSSDVQGQLALPGRVERTASVAERLKPSPSVEAHAYALEGKLTVLNTISGLIGTADASRRRALGIALSDLPAPGYKYNKAAAPAAPRQQDTIGDVIVDRNNNDGATDYDDLDDLPAAAARHEADYFNAAVRAIDNTIALMRLVEARIELYQTLADDARKVRDDLGGLIAQTDARLRAIDVEVEEARHDVGVGDALKAEETERVDSLNARRARILADNVKVVLFRRPRRVNGGKPVPTAPTSAALVESPVAACLRDHPEVPEEIREYASLFRDAPIKWFPAVVGRLHLIDRLESAQMTLAAVQLRATTLMLAAAQPPAQSAPKLLTAVRSAITSQRVSLDARRVGALQINLNAIAVLGLAQAHQALTDNASLGDLIAGDHQRPQLTSLASQEIEQIGQVAACLHDSFGDTPPVIRLGWAEILSEFDQPAPLDKLSGLPQWNELDLDLKRTQQGFVDWLFSRIDRSIPAAAQAINELVRVCLLMAAHAPVDRIIPARLVAPARAEVGSRFDIAVDIRQARIGMVALVRSDDGKAVARAIVEDLSEGQARARVTQTFLAVGMLAAGARVELGGRRR